LMGHSPQHMTSVVSIDQTWLGYQAGIDLGSSFPLLSFLRVVGAGGLSGVGCLRILRTAEADMKTFNRPSWFAILNLPQSMFVFAISHTKAAISFGVLLAGIRTV
jgi:hypothetical protein